MKLLLVADFLDASGYHTLAEGLSKALVALGHSVTVLGINYRNKQHNYPFTVVPADPNQLDKHIVTLYDALSPDYMLLLRDIQRQLRILNQLAINYKKAFVQYRVASLFPVESDPMCHWWARGLAVATKPRFTFTEFGVEQCSRSGLLTTQLPVGLDDVWQASYKGCGMLSTDRFVLTVADNQYRKNLSASFRIMAELVKEQPDIYYVLVTRDRSADGWNLIELAKSSKLPASNLVVLECGQLSSLQLRSLYSGASAFLITPFSEGIGLPVYEALSQGCPVVVSDCCGLREIVARTQHSKTIDIEYITSYPLGNTNSYWVSVSDGVEKLKEVLANNMRESMTFPTWEPAAKKLVSTLEDNLNDRC